MALRGLEGILVNGDGGEKPQSANGLAHFIEYLVRRQRRVVRSTFSAELNALIDSLETLIILQMTLHQVYCGTADHVEELVELLERGAAYPPIDLITDARSVFEAIAATDVCDPSKATLSLAPGSPPARHRSTSHVVRHERCASGRSYEGWRRPGTTPRRFGREVSDQT